MVNKERILERFLKYVQIDTQAVSDTGKTPSSPGQMELAKIYAAELETAGVKNIKLTNEAYLFGTIPGNMTKKVPVVGFVGHFDVASDCPGNGVKPRVFKNYNGEKITYEKNKELVLDPKEDENLSKCVGHTVVVSDGTTLLGGDDKGALAAILEVAEYFRTNPDVKHGDIRLAIMPDEEIGEGAHKMDVKELGADVIYTIDGGFLGEIDIESFNGFRGKVLIEGVNAFPGYGKDTYLNAAKVLSDFVAQMENGMWPQNCADRDPIWWVDEMKGAVGTAEATVYLRNFDLNGIEDQKQILEKIKKKTLEKYPRAKISIDIKESYKNYKSILDNDKRVVEYAKEAVRRAGLEPKGVYVRGGNDSCQFCFAGVVSTNVFIGMQKMHSLREWMSMDVVAKAAETAIEIAKVWAEKS